MANNFFVYKNLKVGKSLIEKNTKEIIENIYKKAEKYNCELLIPEDCMVGTDFEGTGRNKNLNEVKENFKLYGSLPLTKGLKYSKNSKIGLSILKPIRNYTQSYSTKIFEYMAIGLPVITSNFKLYKEIIDENNCGICVDPENPNEIAKAIEFILTNPEKAKEMGHNGRCLVKEKYNWKKEEFKLINIYKTLGC